MDSFFTRYKIEDRSYVALLKREIHLKAVSAKFGETDTGKIDIIVSEITSNLIKHAGEGELLYRITTMDGVPAFEILCIDRGPGISDVPNALRDGTSTTKTMGSGLGAMSRLSNLFQIMSIRNWGTILYSRVGADKAVEPKTSFDLEVKALCIPKLHEEACGDGYRVVQNKSHVKILFGDGLGHGKHAQEAMDTAGDLFSECDEMDPVDIIRVIHEEVRRTRGLVASVAVLDKRSNMWSICGVGNINTRLYTGVEYRNYMAYNGTLGLNIPKSMKSTVIPVERNQHLIMCSDGVTTRWSINQFASIFKYDAIIIAGAIFKDFDRGTDDSSTLIAKVI